jgi:hypothetical protein
MVRFVIAFIFTLIFNAALAGDFEDGWAAYKSGDLRTALSKFRSAAQQGIADAQLNIGYMYEHGQGVTKDSKEAFRWYRLAVRGYQIKAQKGSPEAQTNLASMYYFGQGVLQDYKEALYWYQQAAKQGFSQAQSRLAHMYDLGIGIEENHKEAARLYKLLAKKGDVEAQYSLGKMYENGKGVLQDYIRAHMWFNIAAVLEGDTHIGIRRDLTASVMTAQQIEQAQRMARECMSSNYAKCD